MATATITGTTTKVVTGGTALDRVRLSDMIAAVGGGDMDSNSDLDNVLYQNTPEERRIQCADGSFFDLTGAKFFLRNNGNTQRTTVELLGNVVIGSVDDPRSLDIHLGRFNQQTFSYSWVNIVGPTAVLSMPTVENRIRMYSHLLLEQVANQSAYNRIALENNGVGNEVRFTFYGAPYTFDTNFILASDFNDTSSMVIYYRLGPNLLVRDIELYDGYVDLRPEGVWAPPTRLVVEAQTSFRFLGFTSFTDELPLILGNANDPFTVEINKDNRSDSYFLHGIYPAIALSLGRLVYLNFRGLSWATQMGLYSLNRSVRVENHLVLDAEIIDQLGQPINEARVLIWKKNPVYGGDFISVDFTGPETILEHFTEEDGLVSMGTDSGVIEDAICIESFVRTGSGGDIPGNAYATPAHANAGYASNPEISHAVLQYGKICREKTSTTLALSGQLGDGKQSLGKIQLNDDPFIASTGITESQASSIVNHDTPANIVTRFHAVWINSYGTGSLGETSWKLSGTEGEVDFTDLNVTIDPTTGNGFLSSSAITLKTDGTLKCPKIITTGSIVFNGSATTIEKTTIKNASLVTITNKPAEMTLDNTVLGVFDGDDVTNYTELNGATYRVEENDATIIARGKDLLIFDLNGKTNVTINTSLILTVNGFTAGSRLYIYNETTDTDLYNDKVAGTSYDYEYQLGTDISTDDVIKVYTCLTNSTNSYDGQATATATGSPTSSITVAETEYEDYATKAIDGSLETKYSLDQGNNYFNINALDDVFDIRNLSAWYRYQMYDSSIAIKHFFNVLNTFNGVVYELDTNQGNFLVNNLRSELVLEQSGYTLKRKDDSLPFVNPTTGGGHPEFKYRDDVVGIETQVSALTPAQDSALFAAAQETSLTVIRANQDIINENAKKGSVYPVITGPDTT